MELISSLGVLGAIIVIFLFVFFAVIGFLLPYFVFKIYRLNKIANTQRDQIGSMLNHISKQIDYYGRTETEYLD